MATKTYIRETFTIKSRPGCIQYGILVKEI